MPLEPPVDLVEFPAGMEVLPVCALQGGSPWQRAVMGRFMCTQHKWGPGLTIVFYLIKRTQPHTASGRRTEEPGLDHSLFLAHSFLTLHKQNGGKKDFRGLLLFHCKILY